MIKNFRQYIAAATAALGALCVGMCLGWSSPTEKSIVSGKAYGFSVSEEQFSWIGSFYNLGAAIMCIPSGFIISKIGRKFSLFIAVFIFLLGWMLLIFPLNAEMMWAGRFFLGISTSICCVAIPTYIGEIASKEIRGRLGSLFQLNITLGILLSYTFGWLFNVFLDTIVCSIFPILFGVAFFFMPESPTYLVKKGKEEEAEHSIVWLNDEGFDVDQKLNEIKEETLISRSKKVNFVGTLKKPVSIRALLIGLGLMTFQQLSGINAVIFYGEGIFREADEDINGNLTQVIVGVIQVIATTVAVMSVEKVGRRILLLISGSIMALCTFSLGIVFFLKEQNPKSIESIRWLPVISVCIFIIVFSLGYGPVPWLMMGELYPNEIKEFFGSVASTYNWTLAFIVTKTFVNLKNTLGIGPTFWLFTILSILGCLFVIFLVPETKGKSLNEIQKMLGEKKQSGDT